MINPRTGLSCKSLPANIIFDAIVERAWENGEPGLFFLDTVNKANPTPQLGCIESPNPCSEQPLLPYESCTLGSINLTKMVTADRGKNDIDFVKLAKTVHVAVKFLDSVVDVNCYPLDIVAQASYRTRKIGLGIMGLADMFIMLDIPYASQQAVEITKRIMKYITEEARKASEELAEKRGSFPAFSDSVLSRRFSSMRNATVTTIAPTGSISMIAGCSSGIEPLFALALTRRVLEGKVLYSINRNVLNYLETRNLLTGDVEASIKRSGIAGETNLPSQAKAVLATANEIKPAWHIAHLAAAQQNTDNGVSKTVNLPEDATKSDVAEVFWQAYTLGCKGVTVYRNMSRAQQVLTQGAECQECNI